MVTLVATVVLLGLLIFVHELGHFLAAKGLGVRVERFSLGFPPRMLGKKIGETEYVLSWVPLGGYVKMFGENPDEEAEVPPEERAYSFSHKPAWARFLIVLAGPGFNFVFAFLLFLVLVLAGGISHLDSTVGRVTANGPAAAAGLLPGDRLMTVDGVPVEYFDQVTEAARLGQGREMAITALRAGKTVTIKAKPTLVTTKDLFGDESQEYDLGLEPYLTAVVGGVQPGLPADLAGLKAGDRIVALGGQPVKDWYDVLDTVQNCQGRRLEMIVDRDGRTVTTQLQPRLVTPTDRPPDAKPVYRIGIERRDQALVERVGPVRAVGLAATRTYALTRLTIISVVKLIQRKLSVQTLGGPIFIAELAGKQAEAGLVALFSLCALLSLNLGILNLLPIPVLDGGHLFFFILEIVFRRPINLKIRERAQQVGVVFLIAFMAFVFYNDIARLAKRWTQPAPQVQEIENPGAGHGDTNR